MLKWWIRLHMSHYLMEVFKESIYNEETEF